MLQDMTHAALFGNTYIALGEQLSLARLLIFCSSLVVIIVVVQVGVADIEQVLGAVAPRQRLVADLEVRVRRRLVHVVVFPCHPVQQDAAHGDRPDHRDLLPQLHLLCAKEAHVIYIRKALACAVPWWWCAWAGSEWEAIGLLSAVRKDSVLSRACARRVFERRNALAAVAQARIVCSTARQPGGRGARTLGRRPGEGAAPGPDEQPPRGVAEHDGHVLWPTRRGLERRSAMQSAEGKTRR